MTAPDRPALADVLACVDGLTNPAEAQEALVARGILPASWCGDPRWVWWCETCGGTGWRLGLGYHRECYDCRQRSDRPRNIPDLVAVTSLGVTTILRAHELGHEACRALRQYACPQPRRVAWVVHRRGKDWHKVQGCGNAVVTLQGRLYSERSKPKCAPVAAIWDLGLAIDAITPDAVQIVVPPVGGAR